MANEQTVLVMGASGKTGRLLVDQLLDHGHKVRIITRSTHNINENSLNNRNLSIKQAAILDLSKQELREQVKDCDAVVSCLGHNLSFQGIYGKPRRLVTNTIKRLSCIIQENTPDKPIKLILMNSTGVRNRDLKEKTSIAQRMVVGLLGFLVPPHADNEQASSYLRNYIGQNNNLEWVAVRPDSLTSESNISNYSIHPSPTRSAIFNSGETSRINVAHFMCDLINNDKLWQKWKGKMPVIYNKEKTNIIANNIDVKELKKIERTSDHYQTNHVSNIVKDTESQRKT